MVQRGHMRPDMGRAASGRRAEVAAAVLGPAPFPRDAWRNLQKEKPRLAAAEDVQLPYPGGRGDGSPGGAKGGSLCLCRARFLVHLLPSPEKGVRAAVQSPARCLRAVFQPQLLAACPVLSRACFAFCRAVARPRWRRLGKNVPWHACFHAPKKSRYCNLCFPFPPSWFVYAREMHVHIPLPPPLSLGCRCRTALQDPPEGTPPPHPMGIFSALGSQPPCFHLHL